MEAEAQVRTVRQRARRTREFDLFCELVYNKWEGRSGTDKQYENFKNKILRDWNDPDKMALWKLLGMSISWEVI